jgi:hypothetical protein
MSSPPSSQPPSSLLLQNAPPPSARTESRRALQPPPGIYHRWERPYLNFPQKRLVLNDSAGPRLRRRH